jgi:hypothetical protein
MTNKRDRAIHVTLTRVALPLAIAGIVIAMVLLLPMKERATMMSSNGPSQAGSRIPPIDRNAPAKTKTATLAMG